jgi:WD40 repeat protein
MVDRGTIVRESKFRHLFGKPWKKDLCYTDVKLQSSANQSNAIRVSDSYFAVPWQTAGGGSLVVVPLSLPGPKIPHNYPILNAHKSPVSEFRFHPFQPILASCSREPEIKLWNITGE